MNILDHICDFIDDPIKKIKPLFVKDTDNICIYSEADDVGNIFHLMYSPSNTATFISIERSSYGIDKGLHIFHKVVDIRTHLNSCLAQFILENANKEDMVNVYLNADLQVFVWLDEYLKRHNGRLN